jgi:hypothetical protein
MTLTITRGKHMLLTTFRRNGVGVSTPVWIVPVSDSRIGMWTAAGTGKYKRLRNNPQVTGAAGPLFDEVQGKIHAKYGRLIPIVKRVSRLQGRFKPGQTFGDTVVLTTITQTPSRPVDEIAG